MTVVWQSTGKDLTSRIPSMEIVAVPVDETSEALYVHAGYASLQIHRAKVNDNDLDFAAFGDATGYLTVYPGYVAKQMEPPKENVRSYRVEWCTIYRDEEYYYIRARLGSSQLGENADYDWGTPD